MADTDPNKLFNVRLGQGEKALRILLSKKPVASSASQQSQNDGGGPSLSMVKKRRRVDEIMAHRKVIEAINFYDMGQFNDDGDWSDIAFSRPPNELAFTSGISGTAAFGPTTDDWQAMTDMLMAVDRATWKDYYRKLTYEEAEKYGVDIIANPGKTDTFDNIYPAARNGSRLYPDVSRNPQGPVSSTKWTEKGLKLASSDLPGGDGHFGLQSFGLTFWWSGPDLVTADLPLSVYATHSYDPDATQVPFSLVGKGPTNIFMVPWLMTHMLCNGPSFATGITDYAIGATMPMSRQIYLNMTDPALSYPFFSIQPSEGPGVGSLLGSALNSTHSASSHLFVTTSTGCRFFHLNTGTDDFQEVSNPGNIWTYYWANVTIGNRLTNFAIMNPNHNADGVGLSYVPALVAVIEQKGTWYYIWWNGGPQNAFRIMPLTP